MVDRIGKGGAPPPATGGAASPPAEKTGKTFEVGKPSSATAIESAAHANAVSAPNALEQLKTGKIDLNGYLDMKVHEATAHLEGIGPAHLESIRSMLRDRMATDPELVDLVQQATGQAPNVSEE